MYVMKWQYRTLRTLRERLAEEGANMSDYFSVFGMRTHGTLNSKPVTEQIYVHSKILLVDDRWAVVGSANLNDRSLLGMRDSEVCVVLRDTSCSEGFAAGLRRALFSQLLGFGPEDLDSDPVSWPFRRRVAEIARSNTQIYEELFAVLPSDEVRTWSDLAARGGGGGTQVVGDSMRQPSVAEAEGRLPLVQGRIVEYPLDFLLEEDLAPSFFAAGALTPDAFN
jgi:phospholipase D1/2